MKEKLHIKILENEIVKLRQTKQEDFDQLFNLGGKKEIWEQHSDKDRYKKSVFLEYFNQGLKNEFGSLTIISKDDGKIAGWGFTILMKSNQQLKEDTPFWVSLIGDQT